MDYAIQANIPIMSASKNASTRAIGIAKFDSFNNSVNYKKSKVKNQINSTDNTHYQY